MGRIGSPDDPRIHKTIRLLKQAHLQNNIESYNIARGGGGGAVPVLIPFPLPIRQNLNYVYTLDLDSVSDSGGDLTVSFWHGEEGDSELDVPLTMRRINGRDISDAIGCSQISYTKWRSFIDDFTIWKSHSSPHELSRRLVIAFLRLAAWDFTISSDNECLNTIAPKLPLRAHFFPAWGSPGEDIYWFHEFVEVVYSDLRLAIGEERWISSVVERVGKFVNLGVGRDLDGLERSGKDVDVILISVTDVAFVHCDGQGVCVSDVLPLVANSSATECSAGFRILAYILTARRRLRVVGRGRGRGGQLDGCSFSDRESSILNTLPTGILTMVHDAVEPHDLVSFEKASFEVEKWYYTSSSASIAQLPGLAVQHLPLLRWLVPSGQKETPYHNNEVAQLQTWNQLQGQNSRREGFVVSPEHHWSSSPV
ncbi:hypothetical protein IFR05_003694 [Cadophora sp. M221]|nr:hypothetical protein IFR05_003694 [Cadophora sp. M221]